nr:putative reverse transcriptase domain-containing protein [Tanacetum cinerariifolium]
MDIELCIQGTKGYWASLKIEPNLILLIKEAQKEDAELWVVFQKFEEDEQTKFRVDDDSVMWFGDRLAPICWNEVSEHVIEGPELIKVINEKVVVAKEKLKEARGVRRFGFKGKLSPRFIGPFKILDRVGEVSYRLTLPPQLSHVHNVFHVSLLRGYKYHQLHVVSYPLEQIRKDLSLAEEPEKIVDRQERVMRNKTILFVKIVWKNHPEREVNWETE